MIKLRNLINTEEIPSIKEIRDYNRYRVPNKIKNQTMRSYQNLYLTTGRRKG